MAHSPSASTHRHPGGIAMGASLRVHSGPAPLARTACGDSLEVAPLPADGGIGGADPGAMGRRGRYRQELAALDPGQLPATLMDHPVVAVAEEDQILYVAAAAVAPVHQVMRIGERHWAITTGPFACTG